MANITDDKIQELIEIVSHHEISVRERNIRIQDWVAGTKAQTSEEYLYEDIDDFESSSGLTVSEAFKMGCHGLKHSLSVRMISNG